MAGCKPKWLVQELRRDLEKLGESYDSPAMVEQSEPLRTLVNPNAENLASPSESIDKLQAHARRTDQPRPRLLAGSFLPPSWH